mmetsp:Transcript_29909/g.54121  ORF Transcript_29909/g.54121 Transcript_29909/m.54121 type:complete len:200 (-) Transcript_29909:53-652(-)
MIIVHDGSSYESCVLCIIQLIHNGKECLHDFGATNLFTFCTRRFEFAFHFSKCLGNIPDRIRIKRIIPFSRRNGISKRMTTHNGIGRYTFKRVDIPLRKGIGVYQTHNVVDSRLGWRRSFFPRRIRRKVSLEFTKRPRLFLLFGLLQRCFKAIFVMAKERVIVGGHDVKIIMMKPATAHQTTKRLFHNSRDAFVFQFRR